MQIKRFEAEDMTEALRMVKREFGDDAVILSAKQTRSKGLLGALRKKQVEITAAKDHPENSEQTISQKEHNEPEDTAFSGVFTDRLVAELEHDRVSLSSRPSRRESSTKAPVDWEAPTVEPPLPHRRPSQTRPEQIQCKRTDDVAPASSAPSGSKAGLTAEPFYTYGHNQKVIALVGRCGAGKSTAVAKLACHCQGHEKKRLGLITLDRFRFGANAMLKRFAGMMGLQLATIHDKRQMQIAMRDLADVDVVLIDTPGIGADDQLVMNDIREMLDIANPDEVHLVVNATVREEVIQSTINAFSLLNVNRLLPTHCDEDGGREAHRNLVAASPFPTAFYSDGVDLFNDLQEARKSILRPESAPRHEPVQGQVTPLNLESRYNAEKPSTGGDHRGATQFVANRNSEMFHHPSCKSVKLINSSNIIVFNSIEDAVEARFKPCRACCNISMIKKPAARTHGYQRARA